MRFTLNEYCTSLIIFREGECNMGKKLKPDIKSSKPKFRLFDSLPEVTGPIIRICGNKEVSVDGCRGVTDYYENRIKLSIPGGSVTFLGSNLRITAFTDTSVLIKGRLENVEFAVRTAET